MGVNPDFWRGKRVLVTGHTGFKGGWLFLWLQWMGADVFGFSLPQEKRPFFDAIGGGNSIGHLVGDLRSPEEVLDAVQRAQPEVVFHLGAQALVRQSYLDPVGTFSANVMGTVNLLEAIREMSSVRAVVVVTSDKCYENKERHLPFREEDPMGGKDPYSASKGCAELVTSAWRDSFLAPRVAVATARAGNVIGGGDWADDRLIPDALRAWERGERLTIRNPRAIRPWQYHLDALAGYLMLASELLSGRHVGAWNFGPTATENLSVEDVLGRLSVSWGGRVSWALSGDAQPHEAQLLRLDASKARELLGWKSIFSIDESLDAIVAWHRAWRNGEMMREFSNRQIEHFMGKLNERR